MNVVVIPSPLFGTVEAIASKSEAHRMLICAAIAEKPTGLIIGKLSEDLQATVGCIKAMGASVSFDGTMHTVTPLSINNSDVYLDCGESGSTLRFLLPLCAALGQKATFYGRGKLPLRPLDDLVSAMQSHGISISSPTLPFDINGTLVPGEYELPGNISSQYITGLLLSLPLLNGDSVVQLSTPLQSAAYVDITIDIMRVFGVQASFDGMRFFIKGAQKYISPHRLKVGGDWSNSAFFLTAAAIGKPVTVTALDFKSKQGDKKIIDILRLYGAEAEEQNGCVTVRPSVKIPLAVDVSQIPDLFPILTVAAADCHGETSVFTGISRLRDKESDRVASCAAMLCSLGIKTECDGDTFYVRGGKLRGGRVDSFGDHRIVMAAAIAASRADGEVEIVHADAVRKSYPSFFDDYIKLGGKIRVK